MNGTKMLCLAFFLLIQRASLAQNQEDTGATLVIKDNFTVLDTNIWTVELDKQPGASVDVVNNALVINSSGGATVWLKKPLKGNVEIHYKRQFVLDGGPNDRLSDLNQFWMASDPNGKSFFTRTGRLEEYDSLTLYYMGMGGNYNSTTRFRRYDGQGNRVLLNEFLDGEHLLKPEHIYHIKTVVQDGRTQVWVDGVLFFDYIDRQPLTVGYFGFRSTYSHQRISDFRVYQLP